MKPANRGRPRAGRDGRVAMLVNQKKDSTELL